MGNILKPRKIPASVKRFIITGAILFVAWQLLYNFLLLPSAIPDNQLTHATGRLSAWVLSFFYPYVDTHFTGYLYLLQVGNENTLGIARHCNGLELMALYAGVLIALPGKVWGKIWFSAAGIAGIFLLNVVRCCLLVWLHMQHAQLYHFAHHYAFKLAVYFAAFYGWTLYLKYYPPAKATLPATT